MKPLCLAENDQREVRNDIHYEPRIVVNGTTMPFTCSFVCSVDGDDEQDGKEAPPKRFPYMCSLRRRGSQDHVCGATLFRRNWIVTAAHCVDSRVKGAIGLSPIVYCGIYRINDNDPEKASDGRGASFCDAASLVCS